jgi:hypothetical protein
MRSLLLVVFALFVTACSQPLFCHCVSFEVLASANNSPVTDATIRLVDTSGTVGEVAAVGLGSGIFGGYGSLCTGAVQGYEVSHPAYLPFRGTYRSAPGRANCDGRGELVAVRLVPRP